MKSEIIIKELTKRNIKVYKEVFNNYYENLVVYANNYLFDTSASEDIVQEVFIYLWEKSESLHIKSSFKAYLYAIVRNKCFDFLKSIKITDDLELLELNANLVLECNTDFLSEEDKKIVYNQVLKIVETFPDKMRTIFRLKFISNYKYSEIAQEMGVTVNTVKTQLKRARVKLSQLLPAILCLIASGRSFF